MRRILRFNSVRGAQQHGAAARATVAEGHGLARRAARPAPYAARLACSDAPRRYAATHNPDRYPSDGRLQELARSALYLLFCLCDHVARSAQGDLRYALESGPNCDLNEYKRIATSSYL